MLDIRRSTLVLGLALAASLTALRASAQPAAPPRMPPIAADKMTDAQKAAAAVVAPGGNVPGYLVPMLRSPALVPPSKAIADYLNRNSKLPRRLLQIPILMISRQWMYTSAWDEHYGFAIRDGMNPAIGRAIADNRRPEGLSPDEQALYDFCDELLRTKGVSDKTYARALETFGEDGVVDTIGLLGYYTYLAMFYNVTRLPLGTAPAFTPAVR